MAAVGRHTGRRRRAPSAPSLINGEKGDLGGSGWSRFPPLIKVVGPYRRAVPRAQRYLIHGVTGSGKTTLAAQIGERTGIPWHSMDELTWEPGWVPVEEDVQRQRGAAICAQDAWVMDTAYSS